MSADISLPQAPRPRGKAWRRRRNVLLVVQALIIIHILHWVVFGRTISPIEPSESVAFFRDGVVNLGLILLVLMLASTALLGRWFCGWGCHVLLLQDGCSKLLDRFGFQTKPFRSRSLSHVPFLLGFLMFFWPPVYRWGVAPLSVKLNQQYQWIPALAGNETWPGVTYEFTTSEFWKSFPSFWVAVPFLLICSLFAVWFLGSKGFCFYACPYGGVMAPLDQFAPGRIVVDESKCERCGICTSVCTSHVFVHKEVHDFGSVVDMNCMKCGDCIEACPTEALKFGFTVPPVFKKNAKPARESAFRISRAGEYALLVVWAIFFFGFHGLYNIFPLLMAGGIAAIGTWLVHLTAKTFQSKTVKFSKVHLRKISGVTPLGWSARMSSLALIAFASHSLWVRFESRSIQEMASQVNLDKRLVFSSTPLVATGEMAVICKKCIARHQKIQPMSEGGLAFASSPPTWLARAWCHTALGEWSQAIPFVEQHLNYFGFREDVAGDLGLLKQLSSPKDADLWYVKQISANPQSVRLLEDYTRWLDRQGDAPAMIAFCREHRNRVAPGGPIDLFLMRRLSLATAQAGQLDESVVWFERTLNIEPNNYAAWLRLAEVHLQRGALDSVVASARKARALVSEDPRLLTQVVRMLDAGGAIQEAASLRQQLREDPAGLP